MTRRNDKRNNRRNSRQRNNGNDEASKFASMMMGAIMGKAFEKVFGNKDDRYSSGIHAEGISNQDVANINNGKASLTKFIIPTDGTAVELPVPDNLQVFISEDGKPMIRKKIEGDEKPTNDAEEGKPITYDDICKELFLNKNTYFFDNDKILSMEPPYSNYKDFDNCTSRAQVKRFIAFNKLQNIAKYLNGDWKPDFDGNHENWSINKDSDTFIPMYTKTLNKANIYFKNVNLAYEAIRLMGEDSLNDLFSTDW